MHYLIRFCYIFLALSLNISIMNAWSKPTDCSHSNGHDRCFIEQTHTLNDDKDIKEMSQETDAKTSNTTRFM